QQPLQLSLQSFHACVSDFERKAQAPRGVLGSGTQLVGRLLREPHDLLVVAEVVVAQLGVAVEAKPSPDDPVEAANEEVGEEVRARLVLGAENLIAMSAREPREAVEVGATVRVGDDRLVAGGRLFDSGADPLGPVVQLGRDGPHLDVPAAPGGDLLHVQRERATADDDLRHPGKASWSTNRSLKSERPEGWTYSTSSSTAFAAARSVTERAAIFAPSPATFPAETMRVSGSFGTRPIFTALAALRYEPNEPPSSTCAISPGSRSRSRQRRFQPVAIDAFANWSSRTSRCER